VLLVTKVFIIESWRAAVIGTEIYQSFRTVYALSFCIAKNCLHLTAVILDPYGEFSDSLRVRGLVLKRVVSIL
jgi:hypothetical protein